MADVTYALRQAALATLFEARVASQINRSVPILQLLPKVPADGKNVSWAVSTGTAVPTTAAIEDGVDVTNFNADTKAQAYLNFAVYHDAFGVTGLAESAARLAANPAQMSNLLMDELDDSCTRLGASVGYDLYWGTGSSNKMLGLVDPTAGGLISTGTYATIVRGSYPQFAGNEVSCANGRITVAKVRELLRAIYIASGRTPDFLMATPIVFDQLADVISAQRRMVQEVTLASRGLIRLDGGFTTMDFDGIPVFKDVRLAVTATVSSGKLLAINASEVRVRYMPQPAPAAILARAGIRQAPVTVTPESQLRSGGTDLLGRVVEFGLTGDKTKLATYIYITPQVRTPNTCGILGNINELAI